MSRAARLAMKTAPVSPEGLLFYDDFSAPVARATALINYAIRDVANYDSDQIILPLGASRPSAQIVNTLNQQATVRWQLSWDGVTWTDGDAGTVAAAGATVNMAPNSIAAPWSRLRAVAALAPASGTLVVWAYLPGHRWPPYGLGNQGEVTAMLAGSPIALTGSYVLALKTRTRGSTPGDTASVEKKIPTPYLGRIVELGAIVSMAAGEFELAWSELLGGSKSTTFMLRWNLDTGVLSILDRFGSQSPIATRARYGSNGWADLRVVADPAIQRYAYVALNGEVLAYSAPGYTGGSVVETASVGIPKVLARATAAAPVTALVDRAWARVIE